MRTLSILLCTASYPPHLATHASRLSSFPLLHLRSRALSTTPGSHLVAKTLRSFVVVKNPPARIVRSMIDRKKSLWERGSSSYWAHMTCQPVNAQVVAVAIIAEVRLSTYKAASGYIASNVMPVKSPSHVVANVILVRILRQKQKSAEVSRYSKHAPLSCVRTSISAGWLMIILKIMWSDLAEWDNLERKKQWYISAHRTWPSCIPQSKLSNARLFGW